MPKRVIRSPFMPIKLKKAPPGLARTFPSEIRTAQAAIKFVNSLDPKTRAKLHWRLAASALTALDTGASGPRVVNTNRPSTFTARRWRRRSISLFMVVPTLPTEMPRHPATGYLCQPARRALLRSAR